MKSYFVMNLAKCSSSLNIQILRQCLEGRMEGTKMIVKIYKSEIRLYYSPFKNPSVASVCTLNKIYLLAITYKAHLWFLSFLCVYSVIYRSVLYSIHTGFINLQYAEVVLAVGPLRLFLCWNCSFRFCITDSFLPVICQLTCHLLRETFSCHSV